MDRTIPICTLLFLALLVAAPVVAQQPSSRPEARELVWTWSRRCNGGHKLHVIVCLDRKVLFRGVIPICLDNRDAEEGRVEFHFAGGHTFQDEYRTRSADLIEGDIWQAGGDPDAPILGISFDTSKQILLNTLHVAKPEKRTSSELDRRLFITTYPVAVQ